MLHTLLVGRTEPEELPKVLRWVSVVSGKVALPFARSGTWVGDVIRKGRPKQAPAVRVKRVVT